MRILYAFDNRVPSPQADTEQLVSTLSALSRRPGVEVTLAVPRAGSAGSGAEIRSYYSLEGSFRLVRFDVPCRPRVVQKLCAALRAAREIDPDSCAVLLCRNLPVATAALVAGHRVALDTYRPWPDQAPILRPLLRRLVSSPRFVGACLHSDLCRRSYRKLGVPAERLLTAHNGFEPAHMEPVLARDEARALLGIPAERPVAVYTGRVDREKGLDVVLATARRLADVRFFLVGASGGGELQREARSLENVRLVPWRPPSEVAAWIYAADVLLLPPSRAPLARHRKTVLPMKIFKYLAGGRPILGPRREDVEELLSDGRNARLVRPGDPAGAARALSELLDDPELRRRLSRGARQTARSLTWDARAERIHLFLSNRLDSMPRPPEGRPLEAGLTRA